MNNRPPPRPDRLRMVEKPFGWLPCRLLTHGTLNAMSPDERQLYLLLALASDRSGLSYWGERRIQDTLGCTQVQLFGAREALLARDLIAYDGGTYQLLSWPTHPSPQYTATRRAKEPSPIPSKTRTTDTSSANGLNPMPEHVRQTLREILGQDLF